ncbi:MAG: glutamate racemase [Firmicutes bacterium]|nr:glutamate racemase [Bacillota bacterium]
MERQIGVLDTGVGGLSVVSSLQKLLHNENILYFGDSKNNPYGNKDEEEILNLTMRILEFMEKSDLKLIVIACNTISTVIKNYKEKFKFPIIDIITPTVKYIKELKINDIALLGTEFTIKSGIYQKLLKKDNKDIRIISNSSRTLAAMIDSGDFSSKKVKDTIEVYLESTLSEENIHNIALVCTHYPIVQDLFFEIAPDMNYIDPGYQQALAVKEYLTKNNLLNKKGSGSLNIFTSGEKKIYIKVKEKLGLTNLLELNEIKL